jgi:hypothetical protein
MTRIISLSFALAFATSPALAEVRCNQPYAPDIAVGTDMTKEQLSTMRDDTKSFIAASDIYQACLLKAGNANLSFLLQAEELISKNQREKLRIGKAFNAAAAALNSSGSRIIEVSQVNH